MHSQIHEHLARASAPRPAPERGHRSALLRPPPGRLRGQAAGTLAALAGRLDRERARRVLA